MDGFLYPIVVGESRRDEPTQAPTVIGVGDASPFRVKCSPIEDGKSQDAPTAGGESRRDEPTYGMWMLKVRRKS